MNIKKETLIGKKPVGELELKYLANNHNLYDLTKLDTSWIHSMAGMFYNASTFNQNISNWNTRNVIDMSDMFGEARAFNQDISKWDTSEVLHMPCMFWNATSFNPDLSGWDVRNVLDYEFFAKHISNYKLPRPNFKCK